MVPTPKRQSKTARGPDRGEPEGPRARPWALAPGLGHRGWAPAHARAQGPGKGPPRPQARTRPGPRPPRRGPFFEVEVCLWLHLREEGE